LTTGEDPIVATSEALETLRTVDLGASPKALNAELFLATAAPVLDSDLEQRRTLALASTPWAPPRVSRLGHGPGFDAPDALHTALTLRVLHARGQVPAREEKELAISLWAFGIPRTDRCWGFADEDSSVELTAEVVAALRDYTSLDGRINFAYQSGIACLKAAQRADGSFGSTSATASAVLALLEASGGNAAAVSAGRGYLVATQQANGAWEGSARVTARAVRALAASAK